MSTNDSRGLPTDATHAAETLRWWIRAGVNDALDEAPHDRFAESAAADERVAPAVAGEPSPAAPGTGSSAREMSGGKPRNSGRLGKR